MTLNEEVKDDEVSNRSQEQGPPLTTVTQESSSCNEAITHAETTLAATEHLINPDCNDALLDSMDGCVNYVEGINAQYEHGTTGQLNQQSSLMTFPQELDYLNLCGAESNDERISVEIPSFGEGENTENNNSSPATSPAHSNGPASSCAVCLEEGETNEDAPNRVVFAKLPCCGKADATSTVQICTSCILLLSSPTSDGSSRVGKCPRCRSWIVIATPQAHQDEVLQIKAVQVAGQCRICNQIKDHLVEEDAVCDACFFGRQYPLLYECCACHTTQRIPHPMYRYQPSPIDFGTVTWACHGLCANFTKWRIRPEQVRLIPVGDMPEAWGPDFVEVARARLQLERQSTIVPDENGQCFIL